MKDVFQCEWCLKWISKPYATAQGKYLCSAECMMRYAAVLLGWDDAERVAKEVIEVVEGHKKAEAEKADLPDDLPF